MKGTEELWNDLKTELKLAKSLIGSTFSEATKAFIKHEQNLKELETVFLHDPWGDVSKEYIKEKPMEKCRVSVCEDYAAGAKNNCTYYFDIEICEFHIKEKPMNKIEELEQIIKDAQSKIEEIEKKEGKIISRRVFLNNTGFFCRDKVDVSVYLVDNYFHFVTSDYHGSMSYVLNPDKKYTLEMIDNEIIIKEGGE